MRCPKCNRRMIRLPSKRIFYCECKNTEPLTNDVNLEDCSTCSGDDTDRCDNCCQRPNYTNNWSSK